ncbi:hypothetical protein OHA40_03525 [Nocardia sp. NBC_00508]|uniref:hypothetical protein n=1 Tax=Nocardia sp. NBC_00508 TaxID=2975992 RepID=UPI002E80A3A5|nr:hypothetical protein [Nocardia sp. NBC_00508]WUD67245.1 hypothetical protein OHA40_03525 [Nocardia sp. NBC_00508]
MTAAAWLPPEGDVHLRIRVGGMVFDYVSTATAVRGLIRDWQRKPWCTIELIPDTIEGCRLLPRLPCERLWVADPR